MKPSPVQAIFIGASAGGVTAIQKLLMALPEKFSLPIIVAQHLPADAKIDPAMIFKVKTKAKVCEAEDKAPIESNAIYFAPPGYHLLVERDFTFSFTQEDPVQHARPSIDVLFESAAIAFGRRACAVILTGANADGAAGAKAMQAEGAFVLVQSPAEAEAPVMPSATIQAVKPDLIGSLNEIADWLSSLSEGQLK